MSPIINIVCIGNSSEYFQDISKHENIALLIIENSKDATNYLSTSAVVDAIICNYNLAEDNGLFLFEWVKKQPQFNTIPFILIAKEFNSNVYQLAFKKRVDDYYVTSVTTPEDILRRIEFLCLHKKSSKLPKLPETNEYTYRMPLSKRIFDIFVALTVLLVSSPFL